MSSSVFCISLLAIVNRLSFADFNNQYIKIFPIFSVFFVLYLNYSQKLIDLVLEIEFITHADIKIEISEIGLITAPLGLLCNE